MMDVIIIELSIAIGVNLMYEFDSGTKVWKVVSELKLIMHKMLSNT